MTTNLLTTDRVVLEEMAWKRTAANERTVLRNGERAIYLKTRNTLAMLGSMTDLELRIRAGIKR